MKYFLKKSIKTICLWLLAVAIIYVNLLLV